MKLWPWNEWDGFCLLLVWPARTPSQAPKQAECQPEEEDNEIKASIVVRGRSGVCQKPAAGAREVAFRFLGNSGRSFAKALRTTTWCASNSRRAIDTRSASLLGKQW